MSNTQNPYDTNTVEKKVTRMTAGIHTNVKLVDVNTGTTPNGNKYMELTFSNPQKHIMPKTIWLPGDEPIVRDGETAETAKAREINNFVSQCFDVAQAFYPGKLDLQIVSKKGTAEDFAAEFVKVIKASKAPLTVAVEYNKKGYLDFPRYNWIESYTGDDNVTLRESALNMVKPDTDGKSSFTSRYEEPKKSSQGNDDDLPF